MPKAPKASCWFEKCTAQELSTLLKALGAPSSANSKGDLVERLLQHPVAAPYAHEGRAPILSRKTVEFVGGHEGPTLSSIKNECRQKGLKITGTRYELVLSLLQLAGGIVEAPKGRGPRAPSTKPEDPNRIFMRLVRKCAQGIGDRASWSNKRHRGHAGDVFSMAARILSTEANTEGLLARRDPALLLAVAAVLRAIEVGWRDLPSPSYAWCELSRLADELKAIAAVFQEEESLPAAQRAELVRLCESLDDLARTESMGDLIEGVASAFCVVGKGAGEAAEDTAVAAAAAAADEGRAAVAGADGVASLQEVAQPVTSPAVA